MYMTALEAKNRLILGNDRFVAGKPNTGDMGESRRRDLSENGQHPFAVVVCCSDSRVPPEHVFDQGLGDIFVVRTAGNILDDIGMGSVEYGAEHLDIPLIVVLGHEKCGAVKATIDSHGNVHGCIKAITDKIGKSYAKVGDSQNAYAACEDQNIRDTVAEIKNNALISHLIHEGKTEVVGAKYALATGRVTFND
jgi:carbonic anhydrase